MRENGVKKLWREDRPAFGAWLSIPSAFSAEVMAHQNLDWLCVDTLGIAHANDGQFATAQERAKQALYLAPRGSRSAIEQRLSLYESRKPYHLF